MTHGAQDLSTREVRANFAEVINEAAVSGTVTFITSRGRRIAAVVPVAVGEAAVAASAPPAEPST
ncbi:type II toxin-antitoxin system prevent-host-death family antitoxin [Streptosporangium jomthongense]|uniref:Type II toxin-antitoxin system prevent-host-death family antitoxin n=1 Tax=Streptosporangium jomthongense TaxID=1193683 RepID=A0ABV8FG93_9ACTN